MEILVTGASRGYGASVANVLRCQRDARTKAVKHRVWTLQRKVPAGAEQHPELADNWLQCDLQEPDEVVAAIRVLMERGARLDAVLHFAAMHEPEDFALVNTFDVQHHINANVLNPLFLVRWAIEYGVMREHARVVIPLDRRRFELNSIAFTLSKAAVRPITQAFLAATKLPVIVSLMYLPEAGKHDSADMAAEEIARRVAGDDFEPGVVDLTEFV